MKVVFDTTFLVEIDRRNKNAVELAEKLTRADFELWISTVTVSEIICGVHLRKDSKKALLNARMALAQFEWADLNAKIAAKTGELLAFQTVKGNLIDYQDSVIAATAIELNADFIVTENKKHFTVFPILEKKVFSIKELLNKIKKL